MTTFEVSAVPPYEKLLPIPPLREVIAGRLGAPVEACGANLGDLATAALHPFVAAAHHAFADHYPLTLSPDDVWLCLAQGFAIHVDLHAEELRGRFVRHQGRAIIRVIRDDFVKGSPDNDWPGCFAEFSDQIAEHIGKTRDLVVADFSTTGPIEKAASEVVLMSAMRKYFDYRLLTRCGIPRVTLLGSVEDWRSVRRRAEVLAEFGLEEWVGALLPVLDEIIATAAGKPDQAFWQTFYKWTDGSGGPNVSGWINVLFPYVEGIARLPNGGRSPVVRPNLYMTKWAAGLDVPFGGGPHTNAFPSGLSSAPFLWEYLGSEIPMELLGGFVGVSQDAETGAVRPAMGWAVRERSPV